MPKSIWILIAAIAAIAGGLFYFSRETELSAPADPPEIVPTAVEELVAEPVQVAFELNGLDGNKRQFAEWDGSHRIVNFWATWCAPCRREIPLLKAFQEEHGDDGFQVIGIAVEFPEPVIEYAKQADFNYPILVGEADAMAAAEASGVRFVGLPFTMIVTRDGRLVGAHMGEIHEPELDAIVEVLGRLDAGELDLAAAKATLQLL